MSAGRDSADPLTGADWRPDCDIATLVARARALADVRAYFAECGVLEVDTPVLGRATVTDPAIDSLHAQAPTGAFAGYLQTSPEFHMKRLLAAGAPCIARIGPVFRHDESGRWHNPEFMMIEWYRLGFDLPALMADVATLVDRVLGPGTVEHVTYRALLADHYGFDLTAAPRPALEDAAQALSAAPADVDDFDDAALRDLLFAHALERRSPGRLFVTEFPPALAALARCRITPDGTTVADRFELVIDGIEIANGYHELADAEELAKRMARDLVLRRARGQVEPEADARLLAAMRHGLPSCAGVALGFDRLLCLKLGRRALADVMPFSAGRA
jgi:elongation factor P--(R)-beta-lysine ligase